MKEEDRYLEFTSRNLNIFLKVHSYLLSYIFVTFQGDPGIEGPIGRPGPKVC